MTPLEDELRQLRNWGRFTMDDRAWLERLCLDYPGALERDVRAMRDHWYARAETDRKVRHSKAQWKARFRTWLSKKDTFEGGNGNDKRRGLPGNQYSGALSQFQAEFKD